MISRDNKRSYYVIGIMSGTSLDGVDIAYCEFNLTPDDKWNYSIIEAKTYQYDDKWFNKLKNAYKTDAFGIIAIHAEYGHFLGKLVRDFIKSFLKSSKSNISIDFISSHGHTVFHQPEKNVTFQIGDGASIAAETGIMVICDFRSSDIALGGQGAPLVPIGDRHLFSDYDFCLNLGGFANISFESFGKRLGFDICPVNIVLNLLSQEANKPFDDKGKMASLGNINNDLFNELKSVSTLFFGQDLSKRKALSREWFESNFLPLLRNYNIPLFDKLRTVIEYIAFVVSMEIGIETLTNRNSKKAKKVLVTGGGAYNEFLIDCIIKMSGCKIIIPDRLTIDYKEALIFAFLGVLRFRNEVNCLSSVTGAESDSSGGAVYTVKIS